MSPGIGKPTLLRAREFRQHAPVQSISPEDSIQFGQIALRQTPSQGELQPVSHALNVAHRRNTGEPTIAVPLILLRPKTRPNEINLHGDNHCFFRGRQTLCLQSVFSNHKSIRPMIFVQFVRGLLETGRHINKTGSIA
jgi:hypothetical protein